MFGVESLDLSPAAARSESPSQGREDRGSSDVSRAAEQPSEARAPLTRSDPGHDRPVDGDADREAEGRVSLSPTVAREDEPGASKRGKIRLVKLYLPAATCDELDAAIAASGLSRSTFVGTSFVVGMRSMASVLGGKA